VSTSFFLEYILYVEKNEDLRTIYSNLAIDFSSGVAFLASLLIVKTNSERNDKSFTFLAIGLGLWFCAEVIYTYYQISCNVSLAFPSTADLFWLSGYFFFGTYFYKTIKVWNESKRVKLYSIIAVSLFVTILVGNHIYLNSFGTDSGSEVGSECVGPLQGVPMLGTVFNLSYYFGDGLIVIPALIILWNLRIKDPFFLHRVLISLAVIVTFLADILVIDYAGDFSWYDMVYNFGYICFAVALIWYYKLSQLLNKNMDYCIKQSDDLIKSAQQFIDEDIPQSKETNGVFVNIYDPDKAHGYLRNLLKDAKKDVQILLSPITLMYIVGNRDVYDLLLEKAKQPNMSIRLLIPYNKPSEPYISKLKEDAKNTIKVQYVIHEQKPDRIVLLVDNEHILNITIRKNGSEEEIENATYSNKESIVLCYINIIEYQSLISEI
jgi:hypothetical protein